MNTSATKLLRVLCGVAVMLVLITGIAAVPASAASNGIYIATATPHYRHPVTGEIEDSGGDGSAVLGQSMTESATYKKALVEVDPEGNTYITIRLQLMDNIRNPSFEVDGVPVTASIMQERYGSLSKDNTSDYRMKVNSEASIIRVSMYVVAMGRNVVFYVTVSNLQYGSEDFITSVKVENPNGGDITDTPSGNDGQTDSSQNADASDTPDVDTEQGIVGLQEYDRNGNLVSNGATDASNDNEISPVMGYVILGTLAVGGVAFVVWYYGFFKKKK